MTIPRRRLKSFPAHCGRGHRRRPPGRRPQDLRRLLESRQRTRPLRRRRRASRSQSHADYVEAHGGEIWAESRLGDGARVVFAIPPAVNPPEPMFSPRDTVRALALSWRRPVLSQHSDGHRSMRRPRMTQTMGAGTTTSRRRVENGRAPCPLRSLRAASAVTGAIDQAGKLCHELGGFG